MSTTLVVQAAKSSVFTVTCQMFALPAVVCHRKRQCSSVKPEGSKASGCLTVTVSRKR